MKIYVMTLEHPAPMPVSIKLTINRMKGLLAAIDLRVNTNPIGSLLSLAWSDGTAG